MNATEKLVVRNLFKVFGDDPGDAMALYRQGLDKAAIFERTGMTLGVVDASFTVREGEIFVIMGLSGSGKSTLVRMLNRLIDPTAGEIIADGTDIAKMSKRELLEFRRKHISMVFQSFALMPHLTVLQNTAFGLELSQTPKAEREARALTALEQVGLGAHAQSYPNELSGGMQQRVGLARALANDPSIMLMDEAFSALDPLIRSEMQDELVALQEEQKRTIVFISHDLDEAMRIGDRIAIMEGGRVVQVGTPDEILNNPADDYVKSFFRGVNVSNVLSAGDVAVKQDVTVVERDGNVRSALQRIGRAGRDFAYIVDKRQNFHGVVSVASLEAEAKAAHPELHNAILPDIDPIKADTNIGDIIGVVAQAPCGLPVVDENGRYKGVISRALLLEALNREGAENG
ncbi:glycine betaine/L-proline ABC transporter ATP-binding protein ProV [Roseospira marina]|uniref:Quaternary amine transport ATP-binding protein n=2 Tax=Roseospira marina TaxID=140057 RepID=A0A5M6IC08_9PROT|nr:glycine betaine/L-proline ABC transporter ATP-binding protein ProV [Roseospira marina]KAA5605158.1 glycine betaine/L-proline ABC transporter ATP-binding protein ProV [Roseospira marina]MBB4314915.1 glycine betaine/proline transport system ATP-binding protein [Roseospira marina]MBB5087915.1 glycine betaine/proline transport system ATP-binding protein [Roseospira marina]